MNNKHKHKNLRFTKDRASPYNSFQLYCVYLCMHLIMEKKNIWKRRCVQLWNCGDNNLWKTFKSPEKSKGDTKIILKTF